MTNVININWHPTRTVPTPSPATMQVDYADGTQRMLVAGTDVSGESTEFQAVHTALFS